MVDSREKEEFLKPAVDLLQLSKTDQEEFWLGSLYQTFLITRGRRTSDQYHQFLSGIKRVVKTNILDYSIVTVRELLDSPRNLTVDCTATSKTVRELDRKILSGRFVFTPVSQKDRLAVIHLEDNTGSIPCQFTDFTRRKLIYAQSLWCILSSWRLVREDQGTNYIEVRNFIKEENVDRKKKEIKVHVLSTTDVEVILENKDQLKPGCLNIVGEVSCLSEIIKIKEDLVFCIKLQKNITVIIKYYVVTGSNTISEI
ncbi:uncharacterized protein LOC134276058 [Saccostrea cucullata]|uniref:uncharacterized protein LOC134276058 n=1 Tax=Saccostrea cuccullata TaxID=36930 RepID=UPI002ED19B0F